MVPIYSFLALLLLGIVFGGYNERSHFKRLAREEAELAHIAIVNVKTLPQDLIPGGTLVSGNVVIAIDYFKRVAAILRMFFGGEMRGYQSLMERARREAILRMKRSAAGMGADMIYNVRLEFSAIGTQPQSSGAELLAYGTAVKTSG